MKLSNIKKSFIFLSTFLMALQGQSEETVTTEEMVTTEETLINEETVLTLEAQNLIQHVQDSITLAEVKKSKLPPQILALHGMSSTKGRCLLNNLCSYPNTNYLEIGVWKGSTWVSALFDNENSVIHATAIDDWSKFKGPSKIFKNNCKKFLKTNTNYSIIEKNSFFVNAKKEIPNPITVYFYDGDHSQESQEAAFVYYNDVFDDLFVALVDDWNRPEVQKGTMNAFKKLGYKVLFEQILPSKQKSDVDNWWDGMYIAVISK